ncbi:MAG: RnfABCDGE type electron transport complex subunit D [Candidatus Aenigmatarchaeota archaeon]
MDLRRVWLLLKIKHLMIAALLILTAYGIYRYGTSNLLPIAAITLTAAILDIAISFVKEKKFLAPESAIISGLIISLIIQGDLPLLMGLAAIAILSKHLIRIKGKHIFNPANFALFVGLFLPVSESWWGASNVLLAGILGLVIVFKLKRFHLALPFLAVHAAIMFALYSGQLASHIASGSLVFFAFYMLIELVTSPSKMKGRIAFGVLAGIFATLLYVAWLPAMLVGALFFADLFVPLLNRQGDSKPKPQQLHNESTTNPNW